MIPNSNPHSIEEWIMLDCHISNLSHGVRSRIHVNMINDLTLSFEDEVIDLFRAFFEKVEEHRWRVTNLNNAGSSQK